jgi:hypothetical protein
MLKVKIRQEPMAAGVGSARKLTTREQYAVIQLARKWEQFSRTRMRRRVQVIDPVLCQIKPDYHRTFVRLLDVCDAMHLSPPEIYFGLLFDAAEQTLGLRVYTKSLGGHYFNSLVQKGRQIREEQFAGREDAETLAYRAPKSTLPSYAPESLTLEYQKFLRLRHQYAHFPRGRFWFLCLAEFSGTFLFVNDEYRASGLDLLLHLSPSQFGEWKALEQDQRLATSVKTCFITLTAEGTHGAQRRETLASAPDTQRAT